MGRRPESFEEKVERYDRVVAAMLKVCAGVIAVGLVGTIAISIMFAFSIAGAATGSAIGRAAQERDPRLVGNVCANIGALGADEGIRAMIESSEKLGGDATEARDNILESVAIDCPEYIEQVLEHIEG